MNISNLIPKILVVIILIGSLIVTQTSFVKAQNALSLISATVKLSICGDNIVEGQEDCEGSDLNGKSCTSIGYGGGDLKCDIACSFDTFSCFPITVTPSPALIIDTSNKGSAEVPIKPINFSILPAHLKFFDLRGEGRIPSSDTDAVVRLWYKEYEKEKTGNCDLNDDNVCDIYDFSILMYYVGR
jgi:hypothetical protein